jgi:hypothetical protein
MTRFVRNAANEVANPLTIDMETYYQFCKRFPIYDDKYGRYGWSLDKENKPYPCVYQTASLAGKSRRHRWRYTQIWKG